MALGVARWEVEPPKLDGERLWKEPYPKCQTGRSLWTVEAEGGFRIVERLEETSKVAMSRGETLAPSSCTRRN
jgi:hypothetical protein